MLALVLDDGGSQERCTSGTHMICNNPGYTQHTFHNPSISPPIPKGVNLEVYADDRSLDKFYLSLKQKKNIGVLFLHPWMRPTIAFALYPFCSADLVDDPFSLTFLIFAPATAPLP